MTKKDLLDKLVKMNISVDTYSLNGGLPNEAYCLNRTGETYEVYYSERGQKSGLISFNTENEACEYLYESLFTMLKGMDTVKTDGTNRLKWIECDGGPHLLMEKLLIDFWKGPNCDSHYNKACEIDEYVGLVSVADGYGVVISEDISKSTWIPAKDIKGGFLTVLNYMEEGLDDDRIINEIRNIEDSLFKPTKFKLLVKDSVLYLFAACDTVPELIHGYCEVWMEPGEYIIETVERYDFGDSSFRVHRFIQI